MISMDKTYRTRDGREVRIYAVDGGSDTPVHGAIKDISCNRWSICNWVQDGRFADSSLRHPADLIEMKPKITRTYWLAHYTEGPSAWPHELDHKNAASGCIAITGPHIVEFTEGDGL